MSGALSEKLATDKGLRAAINGFTAVLHTWNQQLGFHPHLHCLVPGVGLNARGQLVRVKDPEFLVYLPKLQGAFRQHFYRLLKEHDWQVDPAVWDKDWGVHIQAAGSGRSALKYLGTYVARTAINDARLVNLTDSSVTFRWKNRAQGNRRETSTISGVEFVARYLRHVLPRGLRSIRYYGFCHPAAKANRLRLQFHTGLAVEFGAVPSTGPGSVQTAVVCRLRKTDAPGAAADRGLQGTRPARGACLNSTAADHSIPCRMNNARNIFSEPGARRSVVRTPLTGAPTRDNQVQSRGIAFSATPLRGRLHQNQPSYKTRPRGIPTQNFLLLLLPNPDSSNTSANSRVLTVPPGLFNQWRICWLRFAPQQYTLHC